MVISVKKLHEDAQLPVKANKDDAGYDIFCVNDGEIVRDSDNNILYIQYNTGISIQPPSGYYTEIYPRSGITKKPLFLANSVGIIDEGYRGEVIIRFKVNKDSVNVENDLYKKGERIAQFIVRKCENNFEFSWQENLSSTNRGEGGFGSSGN